MNRCASAGRGCSSAHLGRPKGKVVAELSLAPVAARLSNCLACPVELAPAVVGEAVRELAENLRRRGECCCSRTCASSPARRPTTRELARELADLAELYVNDAFGVAHRAHASTAGVARLLPNAAGLLLEREVKTLRGSSRTPYGRS